MRSYYAHLEEVKERGRLVKKPIFRASAIFPAIQKRGVTTRLLYLGYWQLKRKIEKITSLVTLRNAKGKLLYRAMEAIEEPRAYRIELSDYLERGGHPPHGQFFGTIEIEFFSATPLVYPYPAVTVNYYGENFCSFVHTAQRVYNDYEDMIVNSQQHVGESGFNIEIREDREPFITIINGPVEESELTLECRVINSENRELYFQRSLGKLLPYEARIYTPAKELEVATFLAGEKGSMVLSFSLPWIFPRLLVGNEMSSPPLLSVTHSYYDCSTTKRESDYWQKEEEGYYSATLALPVEVAKGAYTDIYFYPIYSLCDLTVDLELYDASGQLHARKEEVISLKSSVGIYKRLSLLKLCEEAGISELSDLSARLIAKTSGDRPIPSRIKVALDIGYGTLPSCNLCTNFVPYNRDWCGRKKSFHWMPLFADQPKSAVWLLNNDPAIEAATSDELLLTFYRESDSETIDRWVTIPPRGCIVIRTEEEPQLVDFFQGKVGWMTARGKNPYISSYYFAKNPSGAVGGDHGY